MTKKQIEDKYRSACGIKDDYKFTTDEEYLINEIFKPYNKRQQLLIPVIVQRVFTFPFFAAIVFIGAISVWFKWVWNFAKYGGESIVYTEKMRRKLY
jgi:TRAP-type mannitol/chloroaromatic compound transport system permease small subunit